MLLSEWLAKFHRTDEWRMAEAQDWQEAFDLPWSLLPEHIDGINSEYNLPSGETCLEILRVKKFQADAYPGHKLPSVPIEERINQFLDGHGGRYKIMYGRLWVRVTS